MKTFLFQHNKKGEETDDYVDCLTGESYKEKLSISVAHMKTTV